MRSIRGESKAELDAVASGREASCERQDTGAGRCAAAEGERDARSVYHRFPQRNGSETHSFDAWRVRAQFREALLLVLLLRLPLVQTLALSGGAGLTSPPKPTLRCCTLLIPNSP